MKATKQIYMFYQWLYEHYQVNLKHNYQEGVELFLKARELLIIFAKDNKITFDLEKRRVFSKKTKN